MERTARTRRYGPTANANMAMTFVQQRLDEQFARAEIYEIHLYPFNTHLFVPCTRNAGRFLQALQPWGAAELDQNPGMLAEFRRTLLVSLREFCRKVDTLKLYKMVSITPLNDGPPDDPPIIQQIQHIIREIQNDPTMDATALIEQCRRIIDWKGQLHSIVPYLDQILDKMLLFHRDPSNQVLYNELRSWSDTIFVWLRPGEFHGDVMSFQHVELLPMNIRHLQEGIAHDKPRMPMVFGPIGNGAGAPRYMTPKPDRSTFRHMVVHALTQFLRRVQSLKLYSQSALGKRHRLPLEERIRKVIEETQQADATIREDELVRRYRMIDEWKQELRNMRSPMEDFLHQIMIQEEYDADSFMERRYRSFPTHGQITVFAIQDPVNRTYSDRVEDFRILGYSGFNIDLLRTTMNRDNRLLPYVLAYQSDEIEERLAMEEREFENQEVYDLERTCVVM
jgi:hypothetical protein